MSSALQEIPLTSGRTVTGLKASKDGLHNKMMKCDQIFPDVTTLQSRCLETSYDLAIYYISIVIPFHDIVENLTL